MFVAFLPVLVLIAGTCHGAKVLRLSQSRTAEHASAEPAAKRGKLAVAISGGLRGFDHCAQSLIDSFVKPNLDHFESIDIFVATWDDRGCLTETTPAPDAPSKELIQKVYEAAGHAVRDVWIGPHRAYHEFHRKSPPGGTWPYSYKQAMLDNSHDMWLLWQALMSMITSDHDVIIRSRPDICFSQGYALQVRHELDKYVAVITSPHTLAAFAQYTRDYQEELKITLEPDAVYMGANQYHADAQPPSIPDDMTGFGLYKPMEGVFGTMSMHADAGMFNVTDEQYRRLWGDPAVETGTDLRQQPAALLNPPGTWVREPYPEKVLKHQILRSGYRYALIENAWFSPYYAGQPHRDCD